ncbi:MAG: hypothetical protein JXB04_08875 [Kiritimatiellae bacterium]|nr:hypothetical protein [Kiritimatiellia bacterium]
MKKYIVRMILLCAATTASGALSGLIGVRMMGFRSPSPRLAAAFTATNAMLAFLLALGVPIVHCFCKNRLTRGEPPKWKVVLLAGLLAGGLAGGGLALVNRTGARSFLLAVAIGLALHAAYAARWNFGLKGFLVAAVLLAVLCALILEPHAAVFMTLWLAVVALLDPAWSFARWKRIWPGKPAGDQACA